MPASRKTEQDEDSFEARARNAPLIYRFFNAPDSCAGYLAGRWEGRGIQAVPAWSADVGMRLALESSPTGDKDPRSSVRLALRTYETRKKGSLTRLLRRLGGFLQGRSVKATPGPEALNAVPNESAAAYRAEVFFDLPLGAESASPQDSISKDHSFGPDYARLSQGQWELTVQVLEDVRAHAQLRRLDGLAPIYFSGVLRKTR